MFQGYKYSFFFLQNKCPFVRKISHLDDVLNAKLRQKTREFSKLNSLFLVIHEQEFLE